MLSIILKNPARFIYTPVKHLLLSRTRLISLISKLIPGVHRLKLFGLPSGIETNTKFQLIPIYDSAPVKVSVPEPIDLQFKQNYEGQYFPERTYPECFVLALDNGISNKSGFNLTSSGKLVPKACFEMGKWKQADYSILKRPTLLPELEDFQHSVATLTAPWQSNYFHWLFDILPRIHLIEQAGLKVDKLYVEYKTKFQKETLKILGICNERIIKADQVDFISATRLIIPSLPGVPGIMPGWVCDYLRQKFIPRASSSQRTPRLIYISREDTAKRRIANEQDLIWLLERYGFEVVKLDGMKFPDQVALFNNAAMVVAAHGAGLANMVFCKPATKVVELHSPFWVNACYFDLSQQVGLDYAYLIGDDVVAAAQQKQHQQEYDIKVDPSELKALIESALSKKPLLA